MSIITITNSAYKSHIELVRIFLFTQQWISWFLWNLLHSLQSFIFLFILSCYQSVMNLFLVLQRKQSFIQLASYSSTLHSRCKQTILLLITQDVNKLFLLHIPQDVNTPGYVQPMAAIKSQTFMITITEYSVCVYFLVFFIFAFGNSNLRWIFYLPRVNIGVCDLIKVIAYILSIDMYI